MTEMKLRRVDEEDGECYLQGAQSPSLRVPGNQSRDPRDTRDTIFTASPNLIIKRRAAFIYYIINIFMYLLHFPLFSPLLLFWPLEDVASSQLAGYNRLPCHDPLRGSSSAMMLNRLSPLLCVAFKSESVQVFLIYTHTHLTHCNYLVSVLCLAAAIEFVDLWTIFSLLIRRRTNFTAWAAIYRGALPTGGLQWSDRRY